jgi:hypothetical protein
VTHDDRAPTSGRGLSRRAFLEHGAGFGLSLGALSLGLDGSGLLARAMSPAPSLASTASRARIDGNEITLGNSAIEGAWSVADGKFRVLRVTDRLNGSTLALPEHAFVLTLAGGETITSDAMKIVAGPRTEMLTAEPHASRLAARLGGRQIRLTLEDAEGRVQVAWRAILRDGSRYLRQEVTLRSLREPLPIREITLIDAHVPGATVSGTVQGSPVTHGSTFFGLEHPLSESTVRETRIHCTLTRTLPLRPGTTLVIASVIGVTPPGQLRRDFLTYVERERAHPYRPFLHYNSWYDIGYFSKYTEADALAAIAALGTELHDKRDVTLSSFLFDDGWDDPTTLWHFNAGFPNGFTRVRQAAARYGAAPGVWMSPWGGYGKPRQERLAYGRAQGFETNEGGFVLSGPKYYQRFRETCFEMMRHYGINQFKFDGTGNASSVYPGSAFDSDFDAAINLIGELRAEKPDLYVNLTTGTYPSPFWLRYADSIWRGGEDHDFVGVGSSRQQWITYRDADTYANVVRRGPLYPLNALMLHGLIYARHAKKLDTDPQGDFGAEVRSYFGTGTQLQEMYVTPSLLSGENWDTLAEAARWARRNADTLVDTHWVGGDPAKLEVYGHAAWSRDKGIVTLRNPAAQAQSIALDVEEALELPADAPRQYSASSPWRDARGRAPVRLSAGEPHTFTLRPFEVLTLEALPLPLPSSAR